MENIDVDMYLMIAVKEYKLENMELGALMNIMKALNCLLNTIFVGDIIGLSMSVADIMPPNVTKWS